MKIETDENTSIATTICVVVLAIAAVTMHGCAQIESTKRAAYQAGLEEIQMEGTISTRLGKDGSR